jgi:hypothetical protein
MQLGSGDIKRREISQKKPTSNPVSVSRPTSPTEDQRLTDQLAERVMGWRLAPGRYVKSGRTWMPQWRFQPVQRVEDALRLLQQAASEEYAMGAAENGGFWARVRIASTTGEARESSQARAMTFAIARAVGIDPEGNR